MRRRGYVRLHRGSARCGRASSAPDAKDTCPTASAPTRARSRSSPSRARTAWSRRSPRSSSSAATSSARCATGAGRGRRRLLTGLVFGGDPRRLGAESVFLVPLAFLGFMLCLLCERTRLAASRASRCTRSTTRSRSGSASELGLGDPAAARRRGRRDGDHLRAGLRRRSQPCLRPRAGSTTGRRDASADSPSSLSRSSLLLACRARGARPDQPAAAAGRAAARSACRRRRSRWTAAAIARRRPAVRVEGRVVPYVAGQR